MTYATQLTESTQLRECTRTEALAAMRSGAEPVRRGRGYRVYRSDVHHEIYIAALEAEARS